MIVPTGRQIFCAAEPPWGAIRCSPCFLLPVGRVHGMILAASTTMCRLGHVDDPMWVPERPSRCKEGLPITPGRRGEDLGAFRAAVLFVCPSNIMTTSALQESTR